MYVTRSAVLVIFLVMTRPVFCGVDHNPLLPRPQEIRYGAGQLRVAEVQIGLPQGTTEEDRFAAAELASGLGARANGCLVHFPAGDLMDAVTELREDYRAAWLAEYTPYRIGSSLGRFDREYLYWYGFSRWLRKLEAGFHDGDTLPPLESYRLDY